MVPPGAKINVPPVTVDVAGRMYASAKLVEPPRLIVMVPPDVSKILPVLTTSSMALLVCWLRPRITTAPPV